VLEWLFVLAWLFGPLWLAITLAWWHKLAPPRIPLARIYMALGAAYSVVSFALHVDALRGTCGCELVTRQQMHQYLGAAVILAAMYVEIFARWRRVRSGELVIPAARIVKDSGTARERVRLEAGP
jgi:hypothetical protein